MNRRIHGLPAEARNEKFADLDRGVKQLERKLKEGSVLDTGNRGNNKVSAMAQQLSKKTPSAGSHPANPIPPAPAPASTRPVVMFHSSLKNGVSVVQLFYVSIRFSFNRSLWLWCYEFHLFLFIFFLFVLVEKALILPPQGGSEACHFCRKRVYLMERMSAEGKFFHRGCFRCEYCATTLRLGGYAYVRDDLLGGLFFCNPHVSMTYYMRNKFLSSKKNVARADLTRRSDSTQPKTIENNPDFM